MKTIGLIGGLSWESTAIYYQLLNRGVQARLGGHHSAKCVLVSLDFAEVAALQKAGDWESLTQIMIAAAQQVERGGADGVLIATNTMHLMADEVQQAIGVPLLHIVDATTTAVHAQGLTRIGLLGTRFTMEKPFWADRARANGLEVLIPAAPQREIINQVIYDELTMGRINDMSRQAYLTIIDDLAARGAQGIVLGCTEIGMLIEQTHTPLPIFDTSALHVQQALAWALA